MAGTSAGGGKYSLEKVMGEILELKATQKKNAKQYLDAKSTTVVAKSVRPLSKIVIFCYFYLTSSIIVA